MDSPVAELLTQLKLRDELITFMNKNINVISIKQFKHLDLSDYYSEIEKYITLRPSARDAIELKDLEQKIEKIAGDSDTIRLNYNDSVELLVKQFNIPQALIKRIPYDIHTIGDLVYSVSTFEDNDDEEKEEEKEEEKKEEKEENNDNKDTEESVDDEKIKNDKAENEKKEKEIEKKEKNRKKFVEKMTLSRLKDYFDDVVDSSLDPFLLSDKLTPYLERRGVSENTQRVIESVGLVTMNDLYLYGFDKLNEYFQKPIITLTPIDRAYLSQAKVIVDDKISELELYQ